MYRDVLFRVLDSLGSVVNKERDKLFLIVNILIFPSWIDWWMTTCSGE